MRTLAWRAAALVTVLSLVLIGWHGYTAPAAGRDWAALWSLCASPR